MLTDTQNAMLTQLYKIIKLQLNEAELLKHLDREILIWILFF